MRRSFVVALAAAAVLLAGGCFTTEACEQAEAAMRASVSDVVEEERALLELEETANEAYDDYLDTAEGSAAESTAWAVYEARYTDYEAGYDSYLSVRETTLARTDEYLEACD